MHGFEGKTNSINDNIIYFIYNGFLLNEIFGMIIYSNSSIESHLSGDQIEIPLIGDNKGKKSNHIGLIRESRIIGSLDSI